MIKDEFAEEERCTILYEHVYLSNQNLCERLQENEVIDVENIITDMFKTTRILALKMYEYRKIGSVEKLQQKF